MKKFLALLLALVMALSLIACGGSSDSSDAAEEEAPVEEGTEETALKVGIDVASQVIFKYNVPEDETCADAAVDLAEEGCNIIISDSYGHQSYIQDVAEDYPEVIFVAATGDTAAPSGLANLKNVFPQTFESRYVSGVVAGMKLKELMDAGTVTDPYIGYVGAYPYAEVVSGPSFPRPTWTFSTLTPGMIPSARAKLPTL